MKADRHARVKEVFLRASAIAPERRADFLDTACQGDASLREEVESLLRHHVEDTLLDSRSETRVVQPAAVTLPFSNTQPWLTRIKLRRMTPVALGNRWRNIVSVAVMLVLLIVLGTWTHFQIKRAIRSAAGEQLKALLNAEVLALTEWIEQQKSEAQAWAAHKRLRAAVAELLQLSQAEAPQLAEAPAQSELLGLLQPFLQEDDSADFAVVDRTGRILASTPLEGIGARLNALGSAHMVSVFQGKTQFVRPYLEDAWVLDPPEVVYGEARTWVTTPVRNDEGQAVALLGLAKFAGVRFSAILNVAQMGKSGEAFALDEQGLMLSESRFTDELRRIGLVPPDPGVGSTLHVQIRDPGGNMTRGYRPKLELAARPFTILAAQAIASRQKEDWEQQQGLVLNAYRDYRGVSAIGAWRWLADYDFGVVTKVDVVEADAPLWYLDTVLGLVFVVLVVSLAVNVAYSLSLVRLRGEVDQARQLGQYTLQKLIGEGGMGRVYRARHTLLRRPTAIKILKAESMSSGAVARFEREVQQASQLTHPNTIDIYDYGRTADGIFYYAMEYLPGFTLDQLTSRDDAVSSRRVVSILRQICGSLQEAHAKGLVHRDIKPQNVKLCERGGLYDFVKVLDFGLVFDVRQPNAVRLTSKMHIMGTPLYMAPEQFRDPLTVDPRSDIYSVGAVAYHLVTGRPPYPAVNNLEVIEQVLNTHPTPPSQLAGVDAPAELESVIMRCLAKDIEQRFQSIAELRDRLEELRKQAPWTPEEAAAWWAQNTPDDLLVANDAQAP